MIRAVGISAAGDVRLTKSSAVGFTSVGLGAVAGLSFYGRAGRSIEAPVIVCLGCGCAFYTATACATRCPVCVPSGQP